MNFLFFVKYFEMDSLKKNFISVRLSVPGGGYIFEFSIKLVHDRELVLCWIVIRDDEVKFWSVDKNLEGFQVAEFMKKANRPTYTEVHTLVHFLLPLPIAEEMVDHLQVTYEKDINDFELTTCHAYISCKWMAYCNWNLYPGFMLQSLGTCHRLYLLGEHVNVFGDEPFQYSLDEFVRRTRT